MQNGQIINDDTFDQEADSEIQNCLNLDHPKSFFLFAGAGSGKTGSLVKALKYIQKNIGYNLRLNSQRVAVITYTNAACDEIKSRIRSDPLFSVSTIHSFIWDLIKYYTKDIKQWVHNDLEESIRELIEKQQKGRSGKASIDREKSIQAKTQRLKDLNKIKRFTYNPNGDNVGYDSLNHSEVIKIGSDFLINKPTMQYILITRFPILLIDESQDANKFIIEAFFTVQKKFSNSFLLGLFGDMMQRIYGDGKIDLGKNLPEDWAQPVKKMNHRCPHRIIKLINKIRFDVDKQEQKERQDKEEGFVRLFIFNSKNSNEIKMNLEKKVVQKMAEITKDINWIGSESNVKILTLEHHMAANRIGFLELFESLDKVNRYNTGLRDGTLPGLRFFSQLILPLISSHQKGDKFSIARIIRQSSKYLSKDYLKSNTDGIKEAKLCVNKLTCLWDNGKIPRLIEILQNIAQTKLFEIPDMLIPIANRTIEEQKLVELSEPSEDTDKTEELQAWDTALSVPFTQIKFYDEYISEKAKFGTHQGVKGLEFPRVMVIIDDSEARGFMFNYDKLFGAKELTDTDLRNQQEGKDNSFDRTRRLFYVTCSRAEKSLAIVAYSENPEDIKNTVLSRGWFEKDEIIFNCDNQ